MESFLGDRLEVTNIAAFDPFSGENHVWYIDRISYLLEVREMARRKKRNRIFVSRESGESGLFGDFFSSMIHQEVRSSVPPLSVTDPPKRILMPRVRW